MTASRTRFSDTGEALMDALRKQRVSHNTLVTVEAYVGKMTREYRVTELIALRGVREAAQDVVAHLAADPRDNLLTWESDSIVALMAALADPWLRETP